MSRILVIDDDPDIRRLVRVWLEGEGHDVEEAENGADGVDKAADIQPEVIVCDVMMHKMDGFEVLRHLKGNSDLKEIPVLMLSARGQEDGITRALEEGAADYVVKPFSPRELTVRIKRLSATPTQAPIEPLMRKLRLIERFARTARQLIDFEDLEALSQYVLNEALDATGAERGSFMSRVDDELSISASRGLDERVAGKVRISLGEGIAGRVALDGQPLLVQDIESDPLSRQAHVDRYSGGSLISVPLKVRGEAVAVLNVNTKPENDLFSADDLEALVILADLAALAMARLNHIG